MYDMPLIIQQNVPIVAIFEFEYVGDDWWPD